MEGVVKITSVSKTGIANITIELDLNRNIDSALQEVQTKVAQAQRLLPSNVDPPVISRTNPDDQPIIWLALTYEKDDPYFMMSYAKDYLKNRFTIVPGVGDIILGGYSAKDTKRPAYQKMIRDIRTGKVNLIVVTDLSRLSRNISDFCKLLEELTAYKAK